MSISGLIEKIKKYQGCVYFNGQGYDATDFAAAMADWDEATRRNLEGKLDYILGTAKLYADCMSIPTCVDPKYPYASVNIGIDGSIKYTWKKTGCE